MEAPVFYHKNVLKPEDLQNTIEEVKNLNWCIPPAGIPGNHPPRYVSVLGDGSRVLHNKNKIIYFKQKSFPEHTSYPLYQCAKNSSGIYKMNKITPNLVKLITKIRKLVTTSYNKYAHNVDDMFNVCVCNYYTQKQHTRTTTCISNS